MLNRSILCAVCILGLCLVAGCGKKKNKAPAADFTPITTESPAAIADSDDIFDEFYDDKETTPVKKPATTYSSTSSTPQFDPNGRYVIQVSCVVSKQLAENVVSKLESNGYPAYIAEVENPTPELTGIYQRIRVGGFNALSQAKQFAEEHLMQKGYDYWIDNRSNDNVGMGGSGLGESGYGGYERATPSSSTQEWGASPSTPTQEWGTTEPAVQPQSTPAAAPAVEEPMTPPAPEAAPKPAEQPAPAKEAAPKKSSSEKKDEWGTVDDEWGSDTSGW